MKIKVDKLKYRKRIISLVSLTILFGASSLLVLVMNLLEHGKLTAERILVMIGLGILCAFFAFLTNHFYQLRKMEIVIVYENGILNDYTKRFNKAVNLKIQDIQSISLWSKYKGVTQYKIVTLNYDSMRKGFYNQLKGNDIYLTDYVVDSGELSKLVKLIESECL